MTAKLLGREPTPPKNWRFDTHLPNLLRELIEGHPSPGPLVMAVNLTVPILRSLASRAIEIDDPALNVLMLRLALYEVPADERAAAIEDQEARATAPAPPAAEPVAVRYDFDGHGYRYLDSGSGSDWLTRRVDAEPLYLAPPDAASILSSLDASAAARFVIDYMERETRVEFGDMIGRLDAERIRALASKEDGNG